MHRINSFEEAVEKGALSLTGKISNLAWSEDEIRRQVARGALYLMELTGGNLWLVRTENRDQLYFNVNEACREELSPSVLPPGEWVSEIIYTPAMQQKKEAERNILRLLGFTKTHQVFFLSFTKPADSLPVSDQADDRFLFRNAVLQDLPCIQCLYASCFDPLTDALPDHTGLEEEISRGTIRLVCSKDSGEIIGCVMYQRNKSRLFIRHLAVSPARQRQGIGMALMQNMLCDLQPGEKCMLWVKEKAASARRLYARIGFAPQGREMEIWTLRS